jgi:hypothetical protein
MMSLDRTFCMSPNCINECGRKMTDEERELGIQLDIPIAFAYFCGEDSIQMRDSSEVECWVHTPDVAGSSPALATML